MQTSDNEPKNLGAMRVNRRNDTDISQSEREAPQRESHSSSLGETSSGPGDHSEGNNEARGEVTGFRLTLSGIRGDLGQDSDDDECTSQTSTDSSTRTPPETPAQSSGISIEEALHTSRLDIDRNSVVISHRSSLEVRISFAANPEPEEDGAVEGEGPRRVSPTDPWIKFLYDEIGSTEFSGEHYTHRMLIVLWGYFACADVTEQEARRVADNLHRINDEFLICVSSWEVLEHDQDLQSFMWMVWGALLEVVVRMDYRDNSQDSVVLLVKELLKTRVRVVEKLKVIGKAKRTWKGSEVPTFQSIWQSAYVGFGPRIGFMHPREATPEEWIACSAFLGRLTGAGLTECWGLEVWALDDALSEQYWQGRTPSRTMECVVLAASEYIKHAGERLAVTGSTASGWVRSLSLDRWNSWMDRFGEVADLFDDGPSPVQWAAWFAREHMIALGQKTGFR